MSNFIKQIGNIGAKKTDSTSIVVQKESFVYITLFSLIFGIFWSILYSFKDSNKFFWIPLLFSFLSALGLIYLYFTRDFRKTRIFQIIISLFIPFVFQYFMGGIILSGIVMIWSTISLSLSLTFFKKTTVIIWMTAFLILATLSVTYELSNIDYIASHFNEYSIIRLLLNFSFVSVFVYFFSLFFAKNQISILNKLRVKSDELDYSFKLLNENNKRIQSSIAYSRGLQQSFFMSSENTFKSFGESFTINLAKDIVSGDFLWAHKLKNKRIWLTGDCTGHGVSGAILTVFCGSILNEIVLKKEIYDPATILNLVKKNLIRVFSTMGSSRKYDGMDCSICVWDLSTDILEYSGATNSIYISHESLGKSELLELKTHNIPVGMDHKGFSLFHTRSYKLNKGDVIYCSSDGIIDQFGGDNHKKYLKKRYKNLLLEISNYPLKEQEKLIRKSIKEWKRNNDQTDDIILTGVKIT